MKFKAAAIVSVLIVAVAAVFSAQKEFAPAEDLPGNALIYAEFADLPAFLQHWEKSELKRKYLDSENFRQLKQRRLGLKLASRWQEFNEVNGFPVDLETIGGLAEKRAAIGIYDIGRLEFVFVAPVSAEIFAATRFFQNKDRFEEKVLENGARVFSVPVAADRGRQPQKLLFANVRGRFILATSEQLLAQTVRNIDGATNKNRLADAPDFKNLTAAAEPHLVSVWTNQTALNNDYYFKRYWLMADASELKNIRAGIFEISMHANKIVERRRFLLAKPTYAAPVDRAETRKMLSFVPPAISFYRWQTADANVSSAAIFDAIFDRKTSPAKAATENHFSDYFDGDSQDSESSDYEYLSGKFDEMIDEAPEDDFAESKIVENKSSRANLQNILRAAQPQSVLILTEPRALPAPLFAEFRRAAVVRTNVPVDRIAFETTIAQAARNRVNTSTSNVNLTWKIVVENNLSWRELDLPMLGWEICYAEREDKLIVSNSSQLLREMLAAPEKAAAEIVSASPIDDLTVIDLTDKSEDFDRILKRLNEGNSTDFFLGNIGSLLETVSAVKTVTIEKTSDANHREEKITFVLEQN